jgi:TRAP-type transport system periplasmic protein
LAQQAPVKVNVVGQAIATLPQYRSVDVPLFKALQDKSGGKIEVSLSTWAERNVGGPDILRLVRSGLADIAVVPLYTVSGDVPLLDVVDLPGLNGTVAQARKVADAVVPEANKVLEKYNVKILAPFAFTAQVLFCREPVKSFADLQGRRVRTGGGSVNDFISAIGAQPVGVAFPEVYSALERGTVDCAITGTQTGNSAKWYEVTKGIYTLTTSWSTAAYFVNLSWWNKLDPAVRDLITATMKEVEEKQWQLAAELTDVGIACNIGDAKKCTSGTVVEKNPLILGEPNPADKDKLMNALTQNILPSWVKRCGVQCGELYNKVVAPITGIRYTAK